MNEIQSYKLFTNFSVVAAMLPIIVNLNAILRSECVSTWKLRHSLGKELKMQKQPPGVFCEKRYS